MKHRFPRPWAIVASVSLAACAALEPRAPSELAVPPTSTRVEHRVGTPLGSVEGTGAAERIDAADAMTIEVRARWTERALETGDSLASRARLVSAERGGEAVEAGTWLSHGARVRRTDGATVGTGAGRAIELAPERLALPRGVTASVSLVSEDVLATDEHGQVRKELRIEIGRLRTDGSVAVALVLEDVVARPSDVADRPRTPEIRRESILLEDAPGIGAPLEIELLRPFRGGQARALVLELALFEGADPDDLSRCLAGAREAEIRSGERTAWIARNETRLRELEAAWTALGDRERRRAALLLLAASSGAELCGDVALVADDATLAACIDAILADGVRPGSDASAWALERRAALFLAARAAEEPLAPELEAAVLRRVGELGRSPAALADVTERSSDLEDFRVRVADDNRVLLEDSNPGARVRAYDWLAARGLAPPGFDPLGTPAERRAALEAAESATASRDGR
jgi:hypothetical protein